MDAIQGRRDAIDPITTAVIRSLSRSPLGLALCSLMAVACSAQSPGSSSPSPTDASAPEDTPASEDRPIVPVPMVPVPPLDEATLAHVRTVRARGMTLGNRADVFVKIGDSITESQSFLSDIGSGWFDLGENNSLDATVRFFSTRTIASGRNSFNRASLCATSGWTTGNALEGNPSPLQRELTAARPAYAVVMYGTNDIDRSNLAAWRANMNRILDTIEQSGTVAVLSTIPDRRDGAQPGALVAAWNNGVRELALTRHLPLVDYWLALQPLPNKGLSDDGIHPSVYESNGDPQSGTLTAEGLRFGYNMRNLVTLQALDRLRAVP